MTDDERTVRVPEPRDEAASAGRPSWTKPEVAVIDIRDTQSGGLGNSDGAASHT